VHAPVLSPIVSHFLFLYFVSACSLIFYRRISDLGKRLPTLWCYACFSKIIGCFHCSLRSISLGGFHTPISSNSWDIAWMTTSYCLCTSSWQRGAWRTTCFEVSILADLFLMIVKSSNNSLYVTFFRTLYANFACSSALCRCWRFICICKPFS